MITKNQIKYIHSLGIKKFRDKERCFLAEGPKVVLDLLPLMECRTLFATPEFINKNKQKISSNVKSVIEVSKAELERLSLLCAPRDTLALFEYPNTLDNLDEMNQIANDQLCLALDGVQDPGNLGTIIRIADWFGIEHIFASKNTVDVFSPKVVQATMGAIGRVHVHYIDLENFFSNMSPETPLWGTFLDGKNVYQENLINKGVIVMGNEGNGISPEVSKYINKRLFIPNYPTGKETSESLNVAVATSIICSEFRRILH